MKTQVLKEGQVGSKINGTNLKGYLNGYTFRDLVKAFGRPTYLEPSGDEKVQVEWVIKFDNGSVNEYATIYDWKTYDRAYTTTKLTTWNIGGHVPVVSHWVKELVDQKIQERG